MNDRSLSMKDLGLPSDRCLVIGEVAQAHDGSLGTAHAFIDAIADAGGSAVKFQTHIAAQESTYDEPWRVRFSRQDDTRFDYWKRMEFTEEQWMGLAQHAQERGLLFTSSPFSVAAVELLDRIGVAFWKVASGELGNPELLEAIWATKRPIVFSSGMSTIAELEYVTAESRQRQIPYSVLQCSSRYPCPPEMWGLMSVAGFRDRFRCPSGLSDHSGTIYAGLAAATLGAEIIEVHVAFHKKMFGPDVNSSVTVEEFEMLVEGVNQIKRAMLSGYDKDAAACQAGDMKKIFGRSLALKQDMAAGSVIQERDLTLKKPGSGIPYERRDDLIGRRLKTDKSAFFLLSMEDIE